MFQHFRPAFVLLVLFTMLTGIVYPLAVTAIAALAFPYQAGGSLIARNGTVVGSQLIGQNFASEPYFHARPSATNKPDPNDPSKTVDAPYNAANSGGSNLGPTSQALSDRVEESVAAKRAAGWRGSLPADALTTSASGLDPHISPGNALAQVAGIAKARGLDEAKLRALVERHIEERWLGMIGEPRVNVLMLNLALDEL